MCHNLRSVKGSTRKLWERQDAHDGDRARLFHAVAAHIDATAVLYPGSWVDIAASIVWPDVTYVDTDGNAERFFADSAGVDELLVEAGTANRRWRFVPSDYTEPLPLGEGEVDLLLSFYAGFVSEQCTEHLRIGGWLLATASHGDAAMASIDPRYRLVGVVVRSGDGYRVHDEDLERYMVPKTPVVVTKDLLHERGRGVGWTRPAAAYLFQRVG